MAYTELITEYVFIHKHGHGIFLGEPIIEAIRDKLNADYKRRLERLH